MCFKVQFTDPEEPGSEIWSVTCFRFQGKSFGFEKNLPLDLQNLGSSFLLLLIIHLITLHFSAILLENLRIVFFNGENKVKMNS